MARGVCKFLRVPPDKDGLVHVRKAGHYKCGWIEDRDIKFPVSVHDRRFWPLQAGWVAVESCNECDFHDPKPA